MAAYYFEKGSLENSLRNDKQFAEAARLLGNPDEYHKLLQPKKEK